MKINKQIVGVAIATIATIFIFAGCGGGAAPNDTKTLSGEINGGGSTSVQKIISAAGIEFQAQNPDINFTYSATGSSDGIKGATEGTYAFGCSSRELKDTEKKNIKEVVFAHDGIAIVTHPSNPVTNITKDNLTKIFTGDITNWNELGGNDAPIVVVSREDGSGTRDAVEELLGFKDKLKMDATVKEGNGNVQSTVAGNENSIGYVSLTFVDKTVKAVNVDGVQATVENVQNKTYAVSRPFLIVYKEEKVTDSTKAFINFITSEEGQSIVEKEGGIKISK